MQQWFFWCCGRFHSRTTLSDCRYQGRTPPSAGARTPCPEAKARAGSNTRHGLPHSTCTLLFSCSSGQISGRAPALVSLPKGTLVEQGRHPPGPCSGDLVSAKWFPAHLAEGSRGGMGPSTSVLAQGHAGGAGGATHRTLAPVSTQRNKQTHAQHEFGCDAP